MAEIKWIKITTNMFDDEKIKLIDAMPERDTIFYIWMRLLVQAGKTNAAGYIFLNENVPYSEEMLSTIFNRQLSSIRLALQTLRTFGMIEIEEDHKIKISNWGKHQNIESMDKIREQNRLRKQKQRTKIKELQAPAQEEFCGTKEILNVMSQDSHSMSRDCHAIEIDKEEDKEIEDRLIDRRKDLNKINQAYFNTFYRQISGNYVQRILDILNKGDYANLIIYALEKTKQRIEEQKREKGFNYTLSIIESWINKGYKTIIDVQNNEEKKAVGAEGTPIYEPFEFD